MTEITVYTDGSCDNKKKTHGGWASVMLVNGKEFALYGGCFGETTNQRMEMMAAAMSLKELSKFPDNPVRIITDSMYLKKGASEWLPGWKKWGWMTSEGKGVKNSDLWKMIDRHTAGREVIWEWVKGHAGDKHNEICDKLAKVGSNKALEQGKNVIFFHEWNDEIGLA